MLLTKPIKVMKLSGVSLVKFLSYAVRIQ